ncbi:sulfur transfer complex subunit TusB [Buchnera aphidicola (Cinara tujafilina)]|uniref:Sulfur transfer complex subunit TusB n=1 Tax=Buchnera aphidicola (Cinara tujafilina) TaxID=261317 RepID=F7WZP8_9GAMM|nr:sulfurtransferase complex subunit TusB [Buchnera aphidicola]AEH39923.1 sulfur transfer complex subunit TusB [Buchnera aphidicola (Cinara tujafilina)]
MLHILLHSPYKISIKSLLSLSSETDDLVCIQDGVILGIKNNIYFKKIHFFFKIIYFLEDDLYARGLYKFILKSDKIIDYNCFVKLTAKHKKSITW